uniref:Reverse transcriptase Ty1/copia-type domain-containing protein n=1 Tax=Fagus sylvatica TaxID=28930 RepID=A0A2N9F156_FAGSY
MLPHLHLPYHFGILGSGMHHLPSLVLTFVASLAMAKLKKDIDVMILLLIVIASPAMLSFGSIVCSLRSSSDELPHSSTASPAPEPFKDLAPATILRHSSWVTSLPSHFSYDFALFLRRIAKGIILLLLYVDDMIITNANLSGIQEPLPDPTFYQQLVGSLVYFTVTRPDISYAVHQVIQIMSAPRSTHYAAVLRILRYLKGTLPRYFFLLGSSLISWRSKKQSVVVRSNTEAEYRALADTTSKLLWLRWLLQDLGLSTSSVTPIYCDNRSAIQIARNDVFHEQTKHININCHLVRHHLLQGSLQLIFVSSHDQLADIFTKSHSTRRFRDLVSKLQLVSHLPP